MYPAKATGHGIIHGVHRLSVELLVQRVSLQRLAGIKVASIEYHEIVAVDL